MVLLPTSGLAEALGFVMPILSAFTIFVRFYVRRRRNVQLQMDDWLCVPAWCITTTLCIIIIYASERNMLHADNLPVGDTVNSIQKLYAQLFGAAFPILWNVGTTCVKFSILLFYRRIFVGSVFSGISWFLIGFTSLWTLFAFFSWLFYCGTSIYENFHGSWAVCPTWGVKLQIGVYVWDTVIDFCLLALPWPLVLKLHMISQRKFELLFAFLLGSFAFIASLINTAFQVLYVVNAGIFARDPSDEGPQLVFFYWQTIELGVGLLCCNLPTLQPLYNAGLVYMWSGIVATKQTFQSWGSHYSNALASSKGPHSSNPSGSGQKSGKSAQSTLTSGRNTRRSSHWLWLENSGRQGHDGKGPLSHEEMELGSMEGSKSRARRTSEAEQDLLRAQFAEPGAHRM